MASMRSPLQMDWTEVQCVEIVHDDVMENKASVSWLVTLV